MKRCAKYIPSVLLLILLMVLAGLYSMWLGIDVNFDLLNYHLYNPYAFLEGKTGQDLFAAGVHSALNPLLDIYFYKVFFTFFNAPKWIAFFMGLPYGVLVWLVYYFAKYLFRETDYPKIYAALAAFIGCSAAGIASQIGTTTNEIPLAILNIAAFWLLLHGIRTQKASPWAYAAAVVGGAAVGLKLSAAPFGVGLCLVFLVYLKRFEKPHKVFGWYTVCLAAGFLLTNGYFMWQNYVLYGNPIFPFYNHIFHSPYFVDTYLTEFRFFPQNWLQWLFYPFYWAFQSAPTVAEAPLQDARLALWLYGMGVLGVLILKKRLKKLELTAASCLWIYGAAGYVAWLTQFSILRYAACLEAMCGVVLVGLCAELGRKQWGVYAACLVLGGSMMGYESPDWHHEMFLEQAVVFNQKPQVEDDSLVFFMHLPSSYLAPLLNPKATYMGGFKSIPQEYPPEFRERAAQRNNISAQYYQFRFEEAQRQKIASHTGPIYIVSVDWPMIVNPATLARFGLKGKRENCQRFVNNFTVYSTDLAICRVEKINE